MELGTRIRQLRLEQGLTLRALAEKAGVDHTYLSKIENNKPGFEPGAEKIRLLASALGAEPLELLELAGKVPPELQHMASSAAGRRFYRCSKGITSSEDVMVQREMEKPGSGDKVECTSEQIKSISRFPANPEGERQGGIVPPPFGLGPWVGARVVSPRSPILRPGRP